MENRCSGMDIFGQEPLLTAYQVELVYRDMIREIDKQKRLTKFRMVGKRTAMFDECGGQIRWRLEATGWRVDWDWRK